MKLEKTATGTTAWLAEGKFYIHIFRKGHRLWYVWHLCRYSIITPYFIMARHKK